MDKRTFLTELRRSLRILKEEELRDIISEYEQHIDMKISKGLTEEEAIADFGSLEELKEEILEAYHVRPDYETEQPELAGAEAETPKKEETPDVETGQTIYGQAERKRRFFRQKAAAAASAWTNGVRSFFRKVRNLGDRLGKKLKNTGIWCKDTMKGGVVRTGGLCSRCVSRIWQAAVLLTGWTIRTAWWCVKACWNLWWMTTALVLGGLALTALFCLGVLAVLWMQGYPLAGVTIGCLGVVLSLGSAAVLGFTLMCRLWRRKPTIPEAAGETEVSANA